MKSNQIHVCYRMPHNEDSGRPQHQQKHRNRDSKPYDRRSDDSSTNRRGGSHDNRRSGNHDNRRGGYNDNRRGGYNDNRRGGRGNRRGGYQDNTPVPPEVEAKVKLLFDKSYVFDGGYSLPDSSTWFSNDPFEVCNFFIYIRVVRLIILFYLFILVFN